jgi:hypothetical protein
MKTNRKESFLVTTPSALLATITFFGTFILIFAIGEGVGGKIGEPLAYLVYDLVTAVCCFIIVKHNPISVWYVPIICNIAGIISAIVEPNFWITSLWFYFCLGWVLSLVASIIGARIGRRHIISENPKPINTNNGDL